MTVWRKIVQKPSNSKSPGATQHIDIDDQRFVSDGQGTGIGSVETDAIAATLHVAATFNSGGKQIRRAASVPVIVTGDRADTVTVTVRLAQAFSVQFWGVLNDNS